MKQLLQEQQKAVNELSRQYTAEQFVIEWIANGKAEGTMRQIIKLFQENKVDKARKMLRPMMSAMEGSHQLVEASEDDLREELGSSVKPYRFSFLQEDFWPGGVHVIGAPTGVGKTTTLLNMALEYLLNDRIVLFWAREATASELMRKLYVIKQDKVHNVKTSYKESFNQRDQVLDLYKSFEGRFQIIADQQATGAALRSHYVKMPVKPDLILVDYMQILDEEDQRQTIRENMIRSISEMRELANESKKVLVVATQINMDGNPRESSAIKDNAVLMLSIRRKMDKDQFGNETRSPFLQVKVDKNRHGPLGDYDVIFEDETGRIK